MANVVEVNFSTNDAVEDKIVLLQQTVLSSDPWENDARRCRDPNNFSYGSGEPFFMCRTRLVVRNAINQDEGVAFVGSVRENERYQELPAPF
jgi:hypothetical protein